jgi:multiple sugar transport system substrate-binding protein
MRALLQRLGKPYQIVPMTWARAWEEMVKVAIYKTEPGVSQLASSWISNFVAMGALRPFGAQEVRAMGGASAFAAPAWQTADVAGGKDIWAIPWVADVRIVYYWRDLLEQAGVDEATAFRTPQEMENSLERVQASGVAVPWIIPTHYPFATLQQVASWLWGAGGDFVSPDGKRLLLMQPTALAAIRAYFSLHRYLPPAAWDETSPLAARMFTDRLAAVTIASPNWLNRIRFRYRETPEVADRLGVALPPGPTYVGGSSLAIWQHARAEGEAVELVRLMTSREAQAAYCPQVGYLPARLDALSEPPFSTDPRYRVMVEALTTGRAYPPIARWGLIEERLSAALIRIWEDIFSNPGQDLDGVITRQLESLVQRLELTLAGG